MDWKTAEDFFDQQQFEVVDEDEQVESFDDYTKIEKTRTVRIGQFQFRVTTFYETHSEGSYYCEEWFRNGKLHRSDNRPARIVKSDHAIPEEAYLDEAYHEFYSNGFFQRREDRTYEDLLAYKPLPVRQYLGYDV